MGGWSIFLAARIFSTLRVMFVTQILESLLGCFKKNGPLQLFSDHTFVSDQITTILSICRWPHFCLCLRLSSIFLSICSWPNDGQIWLKYPQKTSNPQSAVSFTASFLSLQDRNQSMKKSVAIGISGYSRFLLWPVLDFPEILLEETRLLLFHPRPVRWSWMFLPLMINFLKES